MKTIWNIVKTETGKKESKEEIHLLNINGNVTYNQQIMVESFNDCFLTIADKITDSSSSSKTGQPDNNNFLNYMLQTFKHPFPSIRFKHTSTQEIEEIIKSLKTKHMDMVRYQPKY
jgi:hypothetical protein